MCIAFSPTSELSFVLAFQMAESLLQMVIENLSAFVQDELATLWGVHSQIQELSGNLAAIHAVLQDAEEKQIRERAVKLWLQKLSDAAHVLDDILDECSIESNRLHSDQCLTRLDPVTIMFRRDIGKRMKEMVDRFRQIDEERRRFELRGRVPERQQEDEAWRQTCSGITEHNIYGREQDTENILEFLSRSADSSNDLSVYPIVGMGGLGKTTLVQRVYNDKKVIEHFDLRIWVCVSTEFNTMRILESIVESTRGHNPNLSTLEAMKNKVQEVLLGKRYLLVLDDVWSTDKWEDLKSVLLCGGGTKGAAILVTTRVESVASVMGTCPAHHLSPLSEDDNWLLFKYHAFGSDKVERTELVAIGKEIVKKCGGSPLASKALGSLLRNKKEEIQWVNVLESKFWDILEDDAIIVRALKISYFHLKLSLRQCFAFCAIFPQDFRMEKEQLIHLWMANGLIKSKGKLEIEDAGNEAWEELCQRSFFQEVEIDELGRTTFKMHDLFHELAQSIMGEECRVYDESASLTNLSTRVHHVTCLKPEREVNMDPFKKAESLRSMINLYPLDDHRNLNGLPPFNSLRALRTNASQLSELKSLTHLRYLNLRSSGITTLPECVSRLQKLQILKLERCENLSCLPKHLTQLKDLRHLLIEYCHSLVEMPPNIGELKCLRTLNLFIVDKKEGRGLSELRDLQLGGKLRIKGLENVINEGDARDANLSAKKKLENLYLSWGSSDSRRGANAERILEALEPPSNLKSFGMNGYSGVELPSWMQNTSILSSLVMVILYDCKNCKHLPPLGKLPHLTVLYVSGMKDVKYIDEDSYDGVDEKAFKSLKDLTLSKLPNLEGMLGDERVEMLPLLSKLKVSCVPKIKLPLLPSLEHIWIKGTGSDSDHSDSEGMASILEAIGQNMQHVKTLCISDFPKLKALPHELSSLSSLQKLEIYGGDELESFSENVLQGLCSLQSLTIHSCKKLRSLSEGMGHLTRLESLDIMICPKLVTLPSNMNKLVSLRGVLIACCDTLPEGLQHVPSLQSLEVYESNSIPEWLGEITSLQKLELTRVRLRSLPSSFRNLTSLRELSIDGCHKELQKRCTRVTGQDWQAIAHIPQFKLIPIHEETFSDKIRSKWRSWQLRRDRHRGRHHFAKDDRFDILVERLFYWYKM
ncbi:disease resistance protein RGA2-like [Arachis hypogaea]|uniref:disease resistance protein RGA2-like n=1 Tax=Arachis hypogaea TaxID=3818 RepID=UPI0010FC4E79|nr:putative disease resistance protein RGA4 [Arachis hypogaea]XP_025697984.2 putative disease resistance protein RGA4 [Arachis hypogaea]XP_029148890.1 putative disease resistance protein RGA4 [Arachis hypogaea]XP_029154003.1 putative disease resistance protein RGA4 [Arachis hypogaea]